MMVVLMKKEIHYEKFITLGIPYRIIDRKYFKKHPKPFFEFYRICKSFNPDVIHTWGSMVTFYALPCKLFLKKPLLNFQIQNAPESLSRFSFDRIISGPNFFFSDVIVANSQAGMNVYGIKKKHAKVIYNGIVMDRIENLLPPAEVKGKYKIHTKYLVVMSARFSPTKKNNLFVEIANYICDQRDDISFFSLGDGDSSIYESCQALIKYPDRIKLPGRIDDVENIVNASDLGVLFTHGEGISNSIMEYMALGKPVIAHGIGGTKEIIQDEVSGLLINNDSVIEIAGKIIGLIDDHERSEKMGLVGKRIIEEQFTIDRMGLEFEKIYKGLLQ